MLFLCGVVYTSLKIPQNINLILQMTGGLFLMILIALFPMVLFNKTMKHAGKYPWTRRFNYLLMASATIIGGLGVYQGIMDIKRVDKHAF